MPKYVPGVLRAQTSTVVGNPIEIKEKWTSKSFTTTPVNDLTSNMLPLLPLPPAKVVVSGDCADSVAAVRMIAKTIRSEATVLDVRARRVAPTGVDE